jgi:energy-coupling factor transporter ATP-binding protein EcfA2
MKTYLTIKRLLAFSEATNKFFYSEFSDEVNIIYGKNTSGKSTLIQSILYTFGINDCNDQLKEILQEKLLFRIDLKLTKGIKVSDLTVIRENEFMVVKIDNEPLYKFYGISGDSSREHIKLKEFWHQIFQFDLSLESKNEYKPASIETIFLPYYVSQSVGWVYLRKSFTSLEYYKNFKDDYLDYYLGIDSFNDRIAKQKLQLEKQEVQQFIKVYAKVKQENEDLKIATISDERFKEESESYLNNFKEKQDFLAKSESDYVHKCNEQSLNTERKSVLRKISINHKHQFPGTGLCPVCSQTLPFTFPAIYQYHQEQNDTLVEQEKNKLAIKSIQSDVNTLYKKIQSTKGEIEREYRVLEKYKVQDIDYATWIKNKSNIELSINITNQLGLLAQRDREIDEKLKQYKTEDDVLKLRDQNNRTFAAIFARYLHTLGVKKLTDDRFTLLYKISSFPYQGVELLKTVLAYHFAFNNIISSTDYIHRFPFILDSIFKEDLDSGNKDLIVKFISENRPKDSQMIISISEKKEDVSKVSEYNQSYFSGKAKLICIGESIKERAFLSDYKGELPEYLDETHNLLYL